jgi:hypothetical protein
MLWRKLTRAMVAIASERTFSTAAAHLTRTFYQMLGLALSVLMRGAFAKIPSPFDVPAERPTAQSLHAPAQ